MNAESDVAPDSAQSKGLRPRLSSASLRQVFAVACLLFAQLSLTAHAIGHEYGGDQDRLGDRCAVCSASHQLGSGIAPVATPLPIIAGDAKTPQHHVAGILNAPLFAFSARGPPSSSSI